MRILHVQETLAPRYGGPAEVLPRLADAQHAAGHDVQIVTTNCDYPLGIYHCPGWGHIGTRSIPVLYAKVDFVPLRVSYRLGQYLRKSVRSFDIIHIHGLYRFPPSYAAYQARSQGVPYIIRPHGSLDPYLFKRSSRSLMLKRLYERWIDFPNLNAASAIHYTTDDERRRASFLGLQAPTFVAPNGVDWERFRILPPRGALRKRLKILNAPMILFLGRIHFKKGLDLLIPALKIVLRSVPDAQLIIIGPENDDYGQWVRAQVHSSDLTAHVHFLGTLYGPDVTQAYVDADVFALPSYTENFGMAVAEAMACALPVVVSDQVNIHTDISSANAGIVTHCDADQVAAALCALLLDAGRRQTMGTAGRRLVQARYVWPAIERALTQHYAEIIDRHRVS